MISRVILTVLALFAGAASAASAKAGLTAEADYDTHLCRFAQRHIVNAGPDVFATIEQFGAGKGFHVIQMDIDAEQRAVSVAMETVQIEIDGQQSAAYVACKMVDRVRVNDVLGLELPGPGRPCRAVNEHTYRTALERLTPAQRERFLAAGRPLVFADDALIATGGEWLPVRIDDFIRRIGDERGAIQIRSPSVRVPWNPNERVFFQGTQHCKLITLATMTRWMTGGAFDPQATLLPDAELDCAAPHSMTSAVGSCLFYFGPASAVFCQDYSGAEWTSASAREECARRHASEAALQAAENRYAGAGGIFSGASCEQRTDAPDLNGACVFNCRRADETLWHISGPADPRMTRGCDLFVPEGAARSD